MITQVIRHCNLSFLVSLVVVAWIFVTSVSAAFCQHMTFRGHPRQQQQPWSSPTIISARRSSLAHATQSSCLSKNMPHLYLITTTTTPTTTTSLEATSQNNRNDDDDDDEDDNDEQSQSRPDGMAQAFRELDALNTIDDDDDNVNTKRGTRKTSSTSSTTTPWVKLVEPSPAAVTVTTSMTAATPEEEVKLYTNMIQELEENDEDDMYSDLLSEMGGTVSSTPASTTTPTTTTRATKVSYTDTSSSSSSSSSSSTTSPMDEAWMNQALQEALEEAKKTSPQSSNIDRASVLNDQQLMKEIEQVFDQAHEKLMAGLDEIRNEQAQWTVEQQKRSSSSSSSSSAFENSKAEQEYRDSAERLTQAESTLTSLLDKVQKETQSVESAVQELERANEELNKDFLLNLRQGGILQQVTLVGALLFTMRTFGLVVTNDLSSPDVVSGAVVQAGVAAAFAIAYALLK